jgi:hypothetical protein
MMVSWSRAEMHPATLTTPSGQVYEMELMTVEGNMIGRHDGRPLSIQIDLVSQGTEQSVGPLFFGPNSHKIVERIIDVFAVSHWAGLLGKQIYALRKERYGLIGGLANVDDPQGLWVVFSEADNA